MTTHRFLWPARALGTVALILGGVLLIGDLTHPTPVRQRLNFDGPQNALLRHLALREREQDGQTYIDVALDDHTVAASEPANVNQNAQLSNYADRYGTRFVLYEPLREVSDWHLIEHLTPAQVRVIAFGVDGAPTVTRQSIATPARRAQRRLETVGAVPRVVAAVPGPTFMLFGAALWLAAGLRVAPAARFTQVLVLAQAVLGTLVAWPILLYSGLRQSFPAMSVALMVTLLVATAFGPWLQAKVFGHGGAQSTWRGALAGLLTLGVFVLIVVNVNGFIAPVFRPPDAGLSPGDWFMQDFVTPATALLSMGAVPALILGFLYGVWGEYEITKPT